MAADVIWREMELTAKTKPMVVSMGGVAASAGYYIATPPPHFCQPSSVTGSIGVFYGKADIAELLGKIGVSVEVYKTTLARTSNPFPSLYCRRATRARAQGRTILPDVRRRVPRDGVLPRQVDASDRVACGPAPKGWNDAWWTKSVACARPSTARVGWPGSRDTAHRGAAGSAKLAPRQAARRARSGRVEPTGSALPIDQVVRALAPFLLYAGTSRSIDWSSPRWGTSLGRA